MTEEETVPLPKSEKDWFTMGQRWALYYFTSHAPEDLAMTAGVISMVTQLKRPSAGKKLEWLFLGIGVGVVLTVAALWLLGHL